MLFCALDAPVFRTIESCSGAFERSFLRLAGHRLVFAPHIVQFTPTAFQLTFAPRTGSLIAAKLTFPGSHPMRIRISPAAGVCVGVILAMSLLSLAQTVPPTQLPPVGGIGIRLLISKDNGFGIAEVVSGSPAEKAGLHAGDVIKAVDGTPPVGDVSARIRGPIGTDVTITVSRDGKSFDFTCHRAALGNAAAPPNAPPPVQPPAGNLPPGLAAGQAPAWLKPGVRLTYYLSSSLIQGGFTEVVRNDKGEIVDRNSGRRYDEIQQNGVTAYTFLKLDVAAVRDNAVALDDHAYTFDINHQFFLAPIMTGEVASPGRGGDTWIDPRILGQQPDTNTDASIIYRQDYVLAGKTYHAIAFSLRTSTSWNYALYDLDTGLLLHSSSASKGSGHLVRNGDAIQQGDKDTILTQSTFVSLRQTHLPWANSPLPKAADADRFTYQGNRVINFNGVVTTIPLAADFLPHDRAPELVPMKVNVAEYALGPSAAPLRSTFERVAAPDEMLPMFIDPGQLERLQQGQEIDRDPETKYVVSVTFVGKSAHGRDIVAITESAGDENPSTQFVYDKANGAAIAVQSTVPALHQQITIILK
jgi:hypothetical protein